MLAGVFGGSQSGERYEGFTAGKLTDGVSQFDPLYSGAKHLHLQLVPCVRIGKGLMIVSKTDFVSN